MRIDDSGLEITAVSLQKDKEVSQDNWPRKGYPKSIGYDIQSTANISLKKGEITMIPTGLYLQWSGQEYSELRNPCYVEIVGRSHTMTFAVIRGIIDYGYTGEVFVKVLPTIDQEITKGNPVAQLIFHSCVYTGPQKFVKFTERQDNKLGSSNQ